MFFSEASIAVTEKPSRAIGSLSSPPPQPMSSRERPSNGAFADPSRSNRFRACSRMKARRQGLNTGSGANLPFGSHHSAAIAETRATSAGSMLQEGAAGEGRGAQGASSLVEECEEDMLWKGYFF